MREASMSDLDQRWIRTLTHPTRIAILQHLLERDEGSPKDVADALGQPLGTVSYHMRRLHEAEQVTLARRTARRGAVAHHYRLGNRQATTDALRRLGVPVHEGASPAPAAPHALEWEVLKRVLTDLRLRREAQGIRRETLARRVGVKTSYLAQVERGEADPRYTLLASLARELGTTFGEVFSRAEQAPAPSGL